MIIIFLIEDNIKMENVNLFIIIFILIFIIYNKILIYFISIL
jgi:hypothetical protein